MTDVDHHRRSLLIAGSAGLILTAGVTLAGCDRKDDEKEVSATEDMMREHGVLRRALLVYSESATRLATKAGSVDPGALAETAKLFRSFGEDYHERQLEEAYVFPAVRKAGGGAAALCDILVAQHARGREITDYILGVTAKGSIGVADAEPLARTLQTFVLMYQNHAAREDTVIFPAWKSALSAHQLDEMGEQFEDIEHKQFGKDGFDDAVQKIAAIEQKLGFADIAQFTPPAPPRL